ncbi:hypothetical protein PAMC26510_25385 [Caballeronia sordidicola]|uniref:Uncharacterized protein n=1 Tax=Caballeronia sordidicola TaxID=196367 RepID=A0A242MGQ1_CABSO|nr:hypothetical protein PAMC26510_25385 [Caballeronia sordidicola]
MPPSGCFVSFIALGMCGDHVAGGLQRLLFAPFRHGDP